MGYTHLYEVPGFDPDDKIDLENVDNYGCIICDEQRKKRNYSNSSKNNAFPENCGSLMTLLAETKSKLL